MSRVGGVVTLCLCVALAACAPVRSTGRIDVLSLDRHLDNAHADADICDGFTLTRANVADYFALADTVDPETFHADAMIMPCSYRGTLRRAGRLYRWEIFAGGAAYLFDGAATNERYLCRERCLQALPNLR